MSLLKVFTSTAILALISGSAVAQTTHHQIPYQGRLDLDGVAMNGAFDFQFELYTSDALGDCGSPAVIAGTCVWADELTNVEVVGGAFSVVLGSSTNPLGDAIWQNVEVFLGIRVAAAGDAYTPLAGRQRILAVPMAARAETAKNYHVTGTLAVEGAATFDAGVTISGPAVLGGASNTLTIDGDQLDAAGGTLYLQANVPGEVRVNGPLRTRCPATMTQVASWCIDTVVQAAPAGVSHFQATSNCHTRKMMVCPIEALMACDHLNINQEAGGCGGVTDGIGPPTIVWTAGPAYDSPYTSSLWSEVAAYNGDNTIDRVPAADSLPYFCCTPGYFY